MTKPKPQLARLDDPGFAAALGVSQAVGLFVIRGLEHGFPTTRSDVLDAAIIAACQLAVTFVLCFAYRRFARWRASDH